MDLTRREFVCGAAGLVAASALAEGTDRVPSASVPVCRSEELQSELIAIGLGERRCYKDRKAEVREDAEELRLALKAKPLESLKPTLPRTEENFRMVLRRILDQTR